MKYGLRWTLYPMVLAMAGILIAQPVFARHPQPIPTKPEHARPPTVTVWGANGSAEFTTSWTKAGSFDVFEKDFVNGGELASADVDGDGSDDVIAGAGLGRSPEVRVFGLDGKLKLSFRAYPAWFKGGVRVAAGDLDGDGQVEIVTAPGPGIEPQINVFSYSGVRLRGVNVYTSDFKGGVHVAAGDLDGDGRAEIITAPGPGGGPHVRLWNGNLDNLGQDFFAFDAAMQDGVTLAVVRTLQGAQIVAAPESWTAPLVRRFSVKNTPQLVKEFYAFATSSRAGVSLTAFDADHDGTDEILAWRNGGAWPEVRQFDLFGTEQRRVLVMDPAYRGGLSLVQTRGDGQPRLAAMPSAPTVAGPVDVEKFIEVDLLRQRLYAYERGRIARTFLVSTGVKRHPTPIMEAKVLKKVFLKDYNWFYGPDNPDNYRLPRVKYNLQIKGPYNIHYAYWHNNFGHPMSHGCINAGLEDAKWIYAWADVGTPVVTHNGTLVVGASKLSKK